MQRCVTTRASLFRRKDFRFWFFRNISDCVWLSSQKTTLQKNKLWFSDKLFRKGYYLNGLSEVYLKRRFELTRWSIIDFWKLSQLISALVFCGTLSDAFRRMFCLLILKMKRGTVRKEKMFVEFVVFIKKFLYEDLPILVKEKVWIF